MKMKDWGPDRMAKLASVSITKAQARLNRARTGLTVVEDGEDIAARLIVHNLATIMHADVRRIIGDLALILCRRTFQKNGRRWPQ